VSRHQKDKTNLDLLKQQTVSGSGISWAICKSAPCPREITASATYNSVFYRLDAFLPPNQQFRCVGLSSNDASYLYLMVIRPVLEYGCAAWHHGLTVAQSKQESLANAKVNTRQHCVSLLCLCNSLTQIEWVADFSLGDEDSENIASERYKNRHLR